MSIKQISFTNKESWKDTLKSKDSHPSPHLNTWGNNYKTSYVQTELENREKHTYGVDKTRHHEPHNMRASPFGLVPAIAVGGHQYVNSDGDFQSFSHVHDYNLKRSQKY